jgi:hypothetical protein
MVEEMIDVMQKGPPIGGPFSFGCIFGCSHIRATGTETA